MAPTCNILSLKADSKATTLMTGIFASITIGVTTIIAGSFMSCGLPCLGVPVILVGAFIIPVGIIDTISATFGGETDILVKACELVEKIALPGETHHYNEF